MSTPVRVSATETRARLLDGEPLLLVCAYDNDEKFALSNLEGAIARSALEAQLPALSKEHEIVFY